MLLYFFFKQTSVECHGEDHTKFVPFVVSCSRAQSVVAQKVPKREYLILS